VGVGFSAGVCTHGGDVEGARELFSKADAALIAAKKGGRDRVVAYGVGAHAGAVEAPSVNGWYQRRPKSPSPAPELSLSTPGRPVQGLPRPLRTPAANPQDPRQKRG
jgi:hypothetical protein